MSGLLELCLIRSGGQPPVLGAPLLDDYLRFVSGRCRPNKVLAAAFDLKVFFTVADKQPEDVRPADVLAFVTAQRSGRSSIGGDLGWHVDHLLAVCQQPLRQGTAGAVTALDRPNPLRPGRDVFAHHGVAGLVGVEPAGRQDSLAMVDDLDRHR